MVYIIFQAQSSVWCKRILQSRHTEATGISVIIREDLYCQYSLDHLRQAAPDLYFTLHAEIQSSHSILHTKLHTTTIIHRPIGLVSYNTNNRCCSSHLIVIIRIFNFLFNPTVTLLNKQSQFLKEHNKITLWRTPLHNSSPKFSPAVSCIDFFNLF